MLSFLSGLVVVIVALLVPATLLALTVRGSSRRSLSALRAVTAALVVALGALGVSALLGRSAVTATATAVGLGAWVLLWAPVARSWAARGLAAWALTLAAGLSYLAYVIAWTVTADLGPLGLAAGLLLWTLEAFVLLVGLAYVWEFVDVVARRRWDAEVDPVAAPAGPDAPRPFVSLHVPTHNEPPDMVIRTLERLLELDYDDYEVLLVDNNTTDPALWRPVEEFCARHDRLVFLHLEDWPGYKSGALNHALTVTDPRAEVIGIVDADYLVDPDFLADCAPLFAADDVAFVQTPQDYRDVDAAPYFRRLYHSYNYFFDVSQRSRNERNGAIFGGTMGLIRRSALTAAGGWDEWCITEDAELSLRLLRDGGRGVHVPRAYGRGVMPLSFEALKRQRFRWCFGGVQILRMHARTLLQPGRGGSLTLGQRWAYLTGGLQWFGDLAALAFTGFLLLGAADAAFGDGLAIRRLSGLLLVSVLLVLVLGVVRALALLRRTADVGWRGALGALGIWMALGLTVARASAQGLVAREGAFLRTPKTRGELGWRDALRGNRPELALALLTTVVGLLSLSAATLGWPGGARDGGAFGATAVGAMLLLQAVGYAAAPANSWAAIRADLPADLRARRRLGLLSWERLAVPVRRSGQLVLGLGVAGVVVVLLAAPLGAPALSELPALAGSRDRDYAPTTADPTEDATDPARPTSRGVRSATIDPTTAAVPSSVPAVPVGSSSAPTRTPGNAPGTTPAGSTPSSSGSMVWVSCDDI